MCVLNYKRSRLIFQSLLNSLPFLCSHRILHNWNSPNQLFIRCWKLFPLKCYHVPTHVKHISTDFFKSYLKRHVLAGPVGRVGLSVGLQDVVKVKALSWRLHISVQDGWRSNAARVKPCVKRQGQERSGEVRWWWRYRWGGEGGSVRAYLLLVSLRSIRYEPSREIPANRPRDLQ